MSPWVCSHFQFEHPLCVSDALAEPSLCSNASETDEGRILQLFPTDLLSWMTPKPKTEGAEQQSAEHEKTGNEQTPSPTEVADSPQIDHEAEWMERVAAYRNTDDDYDYEGPMTTDEAAAIAEAMAQAAAQNVTMQVLMANKRPRTEPEPTEPAEPEEADFYVILSINTPSRTPFPKDLA